VNRRSMQIYSTFTGKKRSTRSSVTTRTNNGVSQNNLSEDEGKDLIFSYNFFVVTFFIPLQSHCLMCNVANRFWSVCPGSSPGKQQRKPLNGGFIISSSHKHRRTKPIEYKEADITYERAFS
jgi:hypothetical protein